MSLSCEWFYLGSRGSRSHEKKTRGNTSVTHSGDLRRFVRAFRAQTVVGSVTGIVTNCPLGTVGPAVSANKLIRTNLSGFAVNPQAIGPNKGPCAQIGLGPNSAFQHVQWRENLKEAACIGERAGNKGGGGGGGSYQFSPRGIHFNSGLQLVHPL